MRVPLELRWRQPEEQDDDRLQRNLRFHLLVRYVYRGKNGKRLKYFASASALSDCRNRTLDAASPQFAEPRDPPGVKNRLRITANRAIRAKQHDEGLNHQLFQSPTSPFKNMLQFLAFHDTSALSSSSLYCSLGQRNAERSAFANQLIQLTIDSS